MSKVSHSFSVSVAAIIGLPEAIILQNLIFLQNYTQDGWVKKSNAAICATYPYFSPKQVRGVLDRLEKNQMVFSKIENSVRADRTKSYYVTDAGRQIYDLPPFAERANGIDKRANGFAKRANDKLTKGQMNIGNISIDNSLYSKKAEGENFTPLKTETHNAPTPNSAQPPAPAAIEAPYSAGAWIQNLTQNPLLRDAFTIGRKIPSSKFDDYLRRFQTVAAATAEQYNREADVKRHFLNWAAIQHQQETKPAPGAPEAKGRPKNIPHYG